MANEVIARLRPGNDQVPRRTHSEGERLGEEAVVEGACQAHCFTVTDTGDRLAPASSGILLSVVGNPGTLDLNTRLQARLNPPAPHKPEYQSEGRIFRLGDHVQQIRNQPHRGSAGVFNGATGTITAIDTEAHRLTVTLHDGEAVPYSFTDLDELLHAYALTVHRSQGSEYPYVVIPMTTSAGSALLQRNLLYTAVTRARRGVVIIGQPAAVYRALANTRTHRSRTALTHRITRQQQAAVRTCSRTGISTGQLAWS